MPNDYSGVSSSSNTSTTASTASSANSVVGFGIFQPYEVILKDLLKKINIIYTGIANWDLNSIKDMPSFTSSLTAVRNYITKEINQLTNIHIPQATNTMNTAVAAKSPSTVAAIVIFIKKLITEIQSAVSCVTTITQIITQLIAIPLLITAKIAELVLHAIMMAEQAVITYLKQLLKDTLSYLNQLKQEMFAYIQQLNGKSTVDAALTLMQNDQKIMNNLTLTGGVISNRTQYNTAVVDYNNNLQKLIIIQETNVYGNFDVDSEVQAYFNLDLEDLSMADAAPYPATSGF